MCNQYSCDLSGVQKEQSWQAMQPWAAFQDTEIQREDTDILSPSHGAHREPWPGMWLLTAQPGLPLLDTNWDSAPAPQNHHGVSAHPAKGSPGVSG